MDVEACPVFVWDGHVVCERGHLQVVQTVRSSSRRHQQPTNGRLVVLNSLSLCPPWQPVHQGLEGSQRCALLDFARANRSKGGRHCSTTVLLSARQQPHFQCAWQQMLLPVQWCIACVHTCSKAMLGCSCVGSPAGLAGCCLQAAVAVGLTSTKGLSCMIAVFGLTCIWHEPVLCIACVRAGVVVLLCCQFCVT